VIYNVIVGGILWAALTAGSLSGLLRLGTIELLLQRIEWPLGSRESMAVCLERLNLLKNTEVAG
jgi:hypothetical protein